jgi:intergrase/recombinase
MHAEIMGLNCCIGKLLTAYFAVKRNFISAIMDFESDTFEFIKRKERTMPVGSNFDDFLKEQGIYDLCTGNAMKGAFKTAPFDAAVYLNDEETITAYLAVAKADSDPNVLLRAVNDIERARELSSSAKIR